MLVLTRRVGESVAIGESIQIVVMEVEGAKTVRLGVTAPADILVRSTEPSENDPTTFSGGTLQRNSSKS